MCRCECVHVIKEVFLSGNKIITALVLIVGQRARETGAVGECEERVWLVDEYVCRCECMQTIRDAAICNNNHRCCWQE